MKKCECADPGCRAHLGRSKCNREAAQTLFRVDMEDKTGTRFCDHCTLDAMESGVFADGLEDDDDDDPDDDSLEQCEQCGEDLEPGQIGLCDDCQDESGDCRSCGAQLGENERCQECRDALKD